MVEGRRVFDGRLRNNFPLQRFISDHPDKPFVALYLGRPDDSNAGWLGTDMVDILIDGEERVTVDKHLEQVVLIDTSPVGTIDFSLSDMEKEFLVSVGRAAALKFLSARKLDSGPTDEAVKASARDAESLLTDVKRYRASRRKRRWFRGIAGVTISIVAWFGWRFLRTFL